MLQARRPFRLIYQNSVFSLLRNFSAQFSPSITRSRQNSTIPPDLLIWQRLILVYCRQNNVDKALRYYNELQNVSYRVEKTFVDKAADAISSVLYPTAKLQNFLETLRKDARIRGNAEIDRREEFATTSTSLNAVGNEETSVDNLLQQLERTKDNNENPKFIWKRLVVAYCLQNDGKNAAQYYDELCSIGASSQPAFLDEVLEAIESVKEPSEELKHFSQRLELETSGRKRKRRQRNKFLQVPPVELVQEQEASVDNLLQQLERTKDNNENPKFIWKRLVVAYCFQNDGKKAAQYFDELCSIGASSQPAFLDEVLDAIESVKEPSEELKHFSERLEHETSGRRRKSRPRDLFAQQPPAELLQEHEMTVEQLEGHVQKLKADGLNYKALLRRLVNLYAENQNHTGVINGVKELVDIGAELSKYILRALVCAAATFTNAKAGQNPEMLKFAEDVLLQLMKTSSVEEIMHLFTSLAYDGYIHECVYLMKFLGEKKPFDLSALNMRSMNAVTLMIEDLVANLVDANKKNEANAILETATSAGYVKLSKTRLENVIQAALDRGDYTAATNVFVNSADKYSITAGVQHLMTCLIRAVDAKQLQRVFDCQLRVHGETDAKFRMVMALCACGKVEQARKVWDAIETPIPKATVDDELQYYANPETFQKLAKICRESAKKHLDLNRVYGALFDSYRKRKSWKDAMVSWAELENEKKHAPSTELYRLYARILRESNRPIPPEVEFLSARGSDYRLPVKKAL